MVLAESPEIAIIRKTKLTRRKTEVHKNFGATKTENKAPRPNRGRIIGRKITIEMILRIGAYLTINSLTFLGKLGAFLTKYASRSWVNCSIWHQMNNSTSLVIP